MQFRQVVEAFSAESAEIRVTNHLQIQIQREIYFRGATHALIALISLIKTTLWGWHSGCCSLVFYEWKLLARANSERSGMTYSTTTTIYARTLRDYTRGWILCYFILMEREFKRWVIEMIHVGCRRWKWMVILNFPNFW